MKKLTNTFKHTHRNEHNTNKTSYLGVEEFYAQHALSSFFFLSMPKYSIQTIFQASTHTCIKVRKLLPFYPTLSNFNLLFAFIIQILKYNIINFNHNIPFDTTYNKDLFREKFTLFSHFSILN